MKNLDWGKLSFGYSKTDYNVRCYYKDGKWSAPEVSDSEMLNIHMASTCLHYGQEAFEGMKAFRGKDGKIRLFRCEENAKRKCATDQCGTTSHLRIPFIQSTTTGIPFPY